MPNSPLCSMDGIKRDQTEAAIITPDANHRNARFMVSLMAPRKQKTTAAPKDVMKNVKPVPKSTCKNVFKLIIKTPELHLIITVCRIGVSVPCSKSNNYFPATTSKYLPISRQASFDSGIIIMPIWNTWNMPS